MKKLAIIGTSNAVIPGCYGDFTKKKLKEQCDIFSVGACSSLLGVFKILQNQIIGFYEYVVFDFNVNETLLLNEGGLPAALFVSYWTFILEKFENSYSIPIILILPNRFYSLCASASYIARAMAHIYNIDIIDMEKELLHIADSNLTKDKLHTYPFYQEYISEKLINLKGVKTITNNYEKISLHFSLFDLKSNSFLSKISRTTSLLGGTVYILEKGKKLELPKNKYICGISYWIEEVTPWLIVENKNINIYKNLNIGNARHSYFCRSLCHSFFNGIKGATISCSFENKDNFIEITHMENFSRLSEHEDGNSALYIRNLLLSDTAPIKTGQDFYYSHRQYFCQAKERLAVMYFQSEQYKKISTKLQKIDHNMGKLVNDILQKRPDLHYLMQDEKYALAKILVWIWLHGQNEFPELRAYRDILENALRHISNNRATPPPEFSPLIYGIWFFREDLHKYDHETKKGQEMLLDWFYNYGIHELQLENAL